MRGETRSGDGWNLTGRCNAMQEEEMMVVGGWLDQLTPNPTPQPASHHHDAVSLNININQSKALFSF